jgi:hydrogenase-4 component B
MMGLSVIETAGAFLKFQSLALIIGIAGLLFVKNKLKSFISISTVIVVALFSGLIAIKAISTGAVEVNIYAGSFIGNLPFRIDALSAWFMLIINFVSVTGVLYGTGYLKTYSSGNAILTMHWILFVLFQSSMLWVCMVQNGIAFIAAWEIMSLSSLLLVIFDHTNRKVLKAGINYLVQMHLSVIFLLVAFIWVYFKTGTFDFKGIGIFFGSNVNIWLFLVFFIGFGFKSGFLGLHTWLPYAHPAAPSHVSGVMSGVIVKMGIYGILRVITFLKADYIILGEIVLLISVFTGLFGILNAAVHRDFKKMLAYCTIENIGIIGMGIGLGLIGLGKGQSILFYLGFGAALLHVLNHSLFKSLLFYSAGSVYQQTHTRDMDKLGGLIKFMPHTSFIFLVGAISIGGIPPFNGFISEFLIYCGLLKGIYSAGISQIILLVMSFAILSVIGGISILTFSKTFGTIFLGSARQNLKHEPAEVFPIMLIPQYLTIVAMTLVVVLSGYIFYGLIGLIQNSFSAHLPITNDLFSYLNILAKISYYSVFFVLLIAITFALRYFVIRKRESQHLSTWGCGYLAPSSRIQYTGKSFSKSLGKLMNFVIIEKKNYNELNANEIFPRNRKYSSFYHDFFELRLIQPLMHSLKQIINLFKFVQNGKVQAYVLYGIIFILVVFLGTILNLWH